MCLRQDRRIPRGRGIVDQVHLRLIALCPFGLLLRQHAVDGLNGQVGRAVIDDDRGGWGMGKKKVKRLKLLFGCLAGFHVRDSLFPVRRG